MATAKPRVSVTLDPDLHAALRELAALNGESLSAVIGGLLEALAPTVLRVVEAGRQFQALSNDMQDQVRKTFTEAEAEISPALSDLQTQAFAALAALESGPHAKQDPRPVTRGSRPPLKSVTPPQSGPEK
jgi:hypothetical protein